MWNPFGSAWGWFKKKLAMMLIKKVLKELKQEALKMEWLGKLWQWFSGKKSILGLILGSIIALLLTISPEFGDPKWLLTTIAVLTWFAKNIFGAGVVHKFAKKFDSK